MRNSFIALTLVLVLAVAFPREGRAQRLAVKTNAIGWMTVNPNAGLEIVTGERTSLSFSVGGHPSGWIPGYEMLVIRPEFRYWFNGRPLTREYVGVGAFAASYAVKPFDPEINSIRGDGLALGLTGGYVLSLGTRLCLDLGGGVGFMLYQQKESTDEKGEGQRLVGDTIFPVKLDVTLIYILK